MSRVDIDQALVLDSFVNAIRGTVLPNGTELNEKNCYLSYYEEPYRVPDIVFVTVTLGDGDFPDGFQVGGGFHQCAEYFEVAVNIWSRHPTNQPGHDSTGLTDRMRGVLPIKSAILRKLVTADLTANWPQGTGGVNTFLRELITATHTDRPQHLQAEGDPSPLTKLTIRFKIGFDHDLTS